MRVEIETRISSVLGSTSRPNTTKQMPSVLPHEEHKAQGRDTDFLMLTEDYWTL